MRGGAGRVEEDDVMDDARVLRLDVRARHVRGVREVRIEHEAVVVVGRALRRVPFR